MLNPGIVEIDIRTTSLGPFAELREANLRFVMSVYPLEQFGSHLMDFLEILYLSSFRNSVEKILVSLILVKNNGYFT
jgi:hypothetical protein